MTEISWQERLLGAEREQMTEKQARIIVAAVELFGEQGYADTSTREIARCAQVSEGSIFKHYATKKALMLNIIRLIVNNMIHPLLDYGLPELFEQPYDDLAEFFRRFLQNRLVLIEENIILIKVILQEAIFQPELRLAFADALLHSHLPGGIEQLQRRGLLRELPEEELRGLLISGFMGYIFTRYIILPELFAGDKEQDREAFAQFMARALGKGEA